MLRVLTYHRVASFAERPELYPSLISATPEAFAQQVAHLARRFRVVSLEEVLHAAEGRGVLPKRAVLITFDDAYTDFADVAWPILKRHKLPALLFVPTAYPDHPERAFWWDRVHQAVMESQRASVPHAWPIGYLPLRTAAQRGKALRKIFRYVKSLPHERAMASVDWLCEQLGWRRRVQRAVMGWGALRALAREGVALGSHTQTHPLMTRISADQARAEILASMEDLRREVGSVAPVFCFPGGAYDDSTLALLRAAKVRLAFTTKPGLNRLNHQDLLQLHRTNITPRTAPWLFPLRLWPGFNALEGWRSLSLRRIA